MEVAIFPSNCLNFQIDYLHFLTAGPPKPIFTLPSTILQKPLSDWHPLFEEEDGALLDLPHRTSQSVARFARSNIQWASGA